MKTEWGFHNMKRSKVYTLFFSPNGNAIGQFLFGNGKMMKDIYQDSKLIQHWENSNKTIKTGMTISGIVIAATLSCIPSALILLAALKTISGR